MSKSRSMSLLLKLVDAELRQFETDKAKAGIETEKNPKEAAVEALFDTQLKVSLYYCILICFTYIFAITFGEYALRTAQNEQNVHSCPRFTSCKRKSSKNEHFLSRAKRAFKLTRKMSRTFTAACASPCANGSRAKTSISFQVRSEATTFVVQK